jgi:hypothetical protein
VVSYEVRPLCGDDEADAAARVCKRAFNRIQLTHVGRMVTCLDEAATCRSLRALAARHKVPPQAFSLHLLVYYLIIIFLPPECADVHNCGLRACNGSDHRIQLPGPEG